MTLGVRRSRPVRVSSAVRRLVQQVVLLVENVVRRRPVTGTAPVVVTLTSHGDRLQTVFLAVETIARGSTRPARLVLSVDDASERARALRSRPLRRLVARGLEIRVGGGVGPHGKWWPYVLTEHRHRMPLVTADDDVLYPRWWLGRLVDAGQREPDVVHCLRAHEFRFGPDGRPAPYMTWRERRSRTPSHAAFLTGVSGVFHPPAFLDRLRADGEAFRSTSPTADDVWLNARAVAHGFRVAQVDERPRVFPTVVGAQSSALWRANGPDRGNDGQIAATFTEDLLDVVRREARAR